MFWQLLKVQKLQKLLEHGIYDNVNADWFYHGKKLKIDSKVSLNRNLSLIVKDEYSETPRFLNEMVNKEYLSTPILTARKNLLKDLLQYAEEENLNYEDSKFPPQKSIYLGLLKATGIHREQNNAYSIHPNGVPGVYQNGPPIPNDLTQVVDAWDNLPKPVKAGILAMVREARK